MAQAKYWQEIMATLSARDIAALYAGYVMMLSDLNEASGKGVRLPGGLSARIELANLYRMSIEEALDRLQQEDPEKFAGIWEWLALSQNEAVRQAAGRMQARGQEAA